jgi:hypothetical protein
MADATLARLGILNGTSDGSWEQDNAVFLEIFSGEVLTVFNTNNIFKDLHYVRTITEGKSASFPALGRANARYHTPGTPILGNNNPDIGKRTISVDDLLIADVFIYDLEDAKLHFDVRREYSKQCGIALSNRFDEKIARLGYLAARDSAVTSDHNGGTVLKNAAAATDVAVLRDLFFKAAQTLDEKDVPEEDRHIIVKPAQYYMLVQDTTLLNRDWGGRGALATADLPMIANMTIHKSNNLPNGNNITDAVAGENNDYTGDFTDSVALVMNKQAVGTVKLFDLAVEMSGKDFHVMYQGDLMVAKYAMGHGILRPDCAVEISKSAT